MATFLCWIEDMLYTPNYAAPPNPEAVNQLIDQYGLATVISQNPNEPWISHLPLLRENESLIGHVARSNPHSRLLRDGAPVTCIFHGPQGYISPAWYVNPLNVPTWNYAVVHIHGRVEAIEDFPQIEAILKSTVENQEQAAGTYWRYDLPAEYREKLVKGIQGFRVTIDRVDAKFKLSLNRDPTDRSAALAGATKHYGADAPLVRLMREVQKNS